MTTYWFKTIFSKITRYLPKKLYGRFFVISIFPLIIVQAISLYVFFDRHLDSLARQSSGTLSEQIDFFSKILASDISKAEEVQKTAKRFDISIRIAMNTKKNKRVLKPSLSAISMSHFKEQLSKKIEFPHNVTKNGEDFYVEILLPNSVVTFSFPQKKLIHSTTAIFLMWSFGATILFSLIALIFLRNQIRPILKLANAADAFGRDLDSGPITPQGAFEIRKTGIAFNRMRERIKKQIKQRTDMLAGISHDLRTPIARMKLQLEMMEKSTEVSNLKEDVHEMATIVEDFLSYIRTDRLEELSMENIVAVIRAIIKPYKNAYISKESATSLYSNIRSTAFRRCIVNILENSSRFATKTVISITEESKNMLIEVEDNGPGIPKEKRSDAFDPFVRLDSSRTPGKGSSGLGLTIARNIVRSHKGRIWLDDSDLGGLKVVMLIPLS